MNNAADYFSKVQANEGWVNILRSFARFVNPSSDSLLLDVGCGPGALVQIFREQANAYGVDADFGMFTHQTQHFSVGKLPELPFASETFDVITSTNVLYLLDHYEIAIEEISRVLKSGGTFAMLNPSAKMTIKTATALADERSLTGFARENFIHWGEVAEANNRWEEADIVNLFYYAGITLTETQTRVGDGLALYAKGIKA